MNTYHYFTCKGTLSDNSQDAKFEYLVGKPDVNSAAMQMLVDAYASEGTKVDTFFKHFACKSNFKPKKI